MKKVGVITFHRALNYGAVFQTYALQEQLKKLGLDTEVIDYRSIFNEKRFQKKSLKELCKPRNIYGIIFNNSYKTYKREKYDIFNSRMKYSNKCSNVDELKKECKKYNNVITGSDQVWNLACTENDDAYFLPFISDEQKKISYAASLGYSKIPEKYKDKYKSLLSNFHKISVREKSGIDIIKELVGKEVKNVVDPTLLLNKENWQKIADYSLVPNEKYIFLYLMSEDKQLIKYAKKLGKENKLKIINITDRLFNIKGTKCLKNITPEQWLGLLEKSEMVITNSFHGTAFSINYEKEFYVKYIPNSISNSRLKDILEDYGQEGREITNTKKEILSYNEVRKLIEIKRNESIVFLKESLNGDKNEK